jgi:hypothetical protein
MKKTTQKILALSWVLFAPSLVLAQNEADPFAAADEEVIDHGPKVIQLVYEVFSMPMDTVAKLQRQGLNDEKLFAEMAIKGKQEVLMITRSLPGHKVTNESIIERIYATEYDPPELPNYVGAGLTTKQVEALQKKAGTVDPSEIANQAANQGLIPATPSNPTAYDTRNEGATLEVEAQLGADNSLIDIRFAAQNVELIAMEEHGQGLSLSKMPLFSNASLMAGTVIRAGKTALVGTVTPKSELLPEEGEARVWLAFITGTLVSP